MRVPLFKDRPTLRPPRGEPLRRVLVILAPADADVQSVLALWWKLRRRGVATVAASECHGEAQGEHGEYLLPNLLLIEAARQDWDAVVFAGGSGALLVAEDQLAHRVAARAEARGRPIAAIGLGHTVIERAGVPGFSSHDSDDVADWLGDRLGLAAPAGGRPVDTATQVRV